MKRIKLSGLVDGSYKAVVSYIFFLIIAALLYLAAVSTSFIDVREKIYFLPDSVWLNLLWLSAAMAVSLVLGCPSKGPLSRFVQRLENDERLFVHLRRGLLLTLWASLSVWVLGVRPGCGGDQICVLNAAYALAEGDFSPLSPVNYLYDYNHQIGLAMVECVLNRVLGEYNFIAYNLINGALITLIYRELSLLGASFGLKRSGQLAVLLLGILFLPLSLYISFIYGTLPGLLLALCAIRLELRYFRGGSWKHALLSAAAIGGAALLKSNYLIFMLGMLFYAGVEIVSTGKGRRILIVLFIGLFYFAQARIPLHIFAQLREADIPAGVSTWAWVVMGLQESENPGWYNRYTLDTLINSDFDTNRQEIWVKEDLKLRLEELWNDKDSARDFFVRKTASQWNEPSFESLFITIATQTAEEGTEQGRLITERDNYSLTRYLNVLNFVVLAGAMLYIVLCSKNEHYHDSLILPMIFIGGFLFHLVWEAKGQYTLPYFVLLLPYTVMGYGEAAGRILRLPGLIKAGGPVISISRRELFVHLALLLIAAAILWYVFHGTLGSITGDGEAYYAYLAAHG